MEHFILAAIAVFFAFKVGQIMGREEIKQTVHENYTLTRK